MNYKKQRWFLVVSFFVGFLLPVSLFAISSDNFIIDSGSELYSNYHDLSSTSFRVEGSLGSVGGNRTFDTLALDTAPSYKQSCGDGFIDPNEVCDGNALGGAGCSTFGYLEGTLTCTDSCGYNISQCRSLAGQSGGGGGGTGGGGGGGAVSAPTVEEDVPSKPVVDKTFGSDFFTFESLLLFFGSKDESATKIEINTSSSNISYPTKTTWNKKIQLLIGSNVFSLRALNDSGSSETVKVTLKRRPFGDTTGDLTVNDYDLSKFVRVFGSRNKAGDFNVDGIVDDYDLSRLIGNWKG